MTTAPHLNPIVQATRRVLALESELLELGPGAERDEVEARLKVETDARFDLVLAAIRAGVDPDLIKWAVDQQTAVSRARVALIVAALRLMVLESAA